MEIKELRVGNYLQGKDTFVEVTEIHSNRMVSIKGNTSKFYVEGENPCLKPIPLTEEVLLRCGAVKSDRLFSFNDFDEHIEFWINEFFSVLFIYSNYSNENHFEIVYESHGEKVHGIKNTEYLHTLQNVLALTGEELTHNHSPSI